MPHRRLPAPPKIHLGNLPGAGVFADSPVSFTISLDPPEFADRAWRESSRCPVCGGATSPQSRQAASIHPTWPSGFSLGIGVWVHQDCFEQCPETDQPAPIPW
jgi:hypothetical protein